jgi:hypothetical protein
VLLIVTIPAAALGTPAAQQSGGNFNVSVAGTAVGSIPHQIDLKATQLPGGQLSEVSGFAVSPEDVVQVKQGENIVVSTSANLKTHNVKVTNTQGQLMDLLPLSSNTWSLQGLSPGVYKLDVIVDMSSSGIMGAYETVLVILAPEQQPLPPTQYITMIQSVSIRTNIIFKDEEKEEPSICYFDPEDKACDPDENGNCPTGFGHNEGDRCVPIGKCPDGYGRLDDDESGTCYPKRDIKTCPDGYITHKFAQCPEPPCPDGQVGEDCRIICTMEMSYGRGPCDEHYIPPDENGQCPEGHQFVDEETGCVPDEFGLLPPPDCNVEDPPPECEESIVCDDGSTVPPGEPCPEPPGPPECPEGQVGTPPDCQTPPGILPPPENGDEGDNGDNGNTNNDNENNNDPDNEGSDGDNNDNNESNQENNEPSNSDSEGSESSNLEGE